MINQYSEDAIALLKKLIITQSFSREEDPTAIILEDWFKSHHIPFERKGHNLWAFNKYYDESKPSIVLNSHHDTVRPNKNYTRDPFAATIEDGKLYGLGSNDAGGCLVGLLHTFLHFYESKDLNYNLIMAATAEEEISGAGGIASILDQFATPEFGIVGEPTLLDLAIAEKGLLVLDIKVKGTSGHAAHIYEDQAMMNTISVLEWFRSFEFPKVSEKLGKVKMTVTQINAGSQHNVVPAEVNLTVDIRVTDAYQNKEVYEIINKAIGSEKVVITPRSFRLNSSGISPEHPFVQAGIAMGKKTYGSPTLSDQTHMNFPSLKIGPGDSSRSHSADEFIYINEIEEGINTYISLLEKIV